MSQDARLDEELNTQRRAQILNLGYYDSSTPDSKRKYDIFSPNEVTQYRAVPLLVDDHHITIGVTNNTSKQTMNSLRQRFLDHKTDFLMISDSGFREFVMLYNPPKEIIYNDISLVAGGEDQLRNVSSTLSQVKADDMLAYLVDQAHQLGSSDIHLEPQRDHTRVRFRVDGVLHKVAELAQDRYRLLVSAVASAGNLSTAANEAQQGHISQKATMADGTSVDVNVRLETVPGVNGMEIVMRLFNMNSEMYVLDRLGLSQAERTVVDNIIAKPSGLVMVVGPTGSGKTTTLYSMLNSLNNLERKIITIEDPVEYQFPGISQISITSQNSQEKNFAEKLRAVLRLDPDIIMVGEIRDSDTAKTALQAALTGHLVLATFHAGSAAAALTRLVDLIGYNPLFISSIRLIMAQRLVRRLDDATKQQVHPDAPTVANIQRVIDSLPVSSERPDLNNLALYHPGKSAENPYGFNGQIAIREQLLMTPAVANLIGASHDATSQQIEQTAVADGMKTMLQDGILKAINGETTMEEIFRVVG